MNIDRGNLEAGQELHNYTRTYKLPYHVVMEFSKHKSTKENKNTKLQYNAYRQGVLTRANQKCKGKARQQIYKQHFESNYENFSVWGK